MYPDYINKNPSFCQEDNLAIIYWIAYMCMSNNSSSSGIHSATDNNIETASMDYTAFHQDTKIEFVDIKTIYISEDEESEEVDDIDVELLCEADEAAISKRYQVFFDSWIMNKFLKWNCTLSSSTTFTYRLKWCQLGRGENIVNIGQKERAAATQHFKDIELELIEKLILEELTYGEHANELK